MKFKTDFVTNSSSSSFIVAFDKIVKDFEDVKYLINREGKARQVLKDCLAQKPKKIKLSQSLINTVKEDLSHGYMGVDYIKFQEQFCERERITSNELYINRPWYNAFTDEYNKVNEKVYLEKAIKFIKENEGKYLYVFSYADEDGEFMSEMEHGFTFSQLPHIQISQH